MLAPASEIERRGERSGEASDRCWCAATIVDPQANLWLFTRHLYQLVRRHLHVAENAILPVLPDQSASRADVGQVCSRNLSDVKMISAAPASALVDGHEGFRIDPG